MVWWIKGVEGLVKKYHPSLPRVYCSARRVRTLLVCSDSW